MASHNMSMNRHGLHTESPITSVMKYYCVDREKANDASHGVDCSDPYPVDFEIVLEKAVKAFVSGNCLDVCESHLYQGLFGKFLSSHKGRDAATVARFKKEREDCRSYIEENGFE